MINNILQQICKLNVELQLDWDGNTGIYSNSSLTLYLDDFDLEISIYIYSKREVIPSNYFSPAEQHILKNEFDIFDIRAFENKEGNEIKLTEKDWDNIKDYLKDQIKWI